MIQDLHVYIIASVFVLIVAAFIMYTVHRKNRKPQTVDTVAEAEPVIDRKLFGIVGGAHSRKTTVALEHVVRYHQIGYNVVLINSEEQVDSLYQRIRDLSGSSSDEDLSILIKGIDITTKEKLYEELLTANEVTGGMPSVFVFDINASSNTVEWLIENLDRFMAHHVVVTISALRTDDEPNNSVFGLAFDAAGGQSPTDIEFYKTLPILADSMPVEFD